MRRRKEGVREEGKKERGRRREGGWVAGWGTYLGQQKENEKNNQRREESHGEKEEMT